MTETPALILDLVGSGSAQPRRGRVRARKAARTSAEPLPDFPRVAWIQVEPSRFVRVEGGIQAIDQAQTKETAVGASPETDTPVDVPARAPTTTLTGQASHYPLVMLSSDVGIVRACDNCVLGSVTEEYGIAPSAFGPAPLASSSVEDQAQDVSGVFASPEANSGSIANLGCKIPQGGADAEPFWLYRWRSSGRTGQVVPSMASAMAGLVRASAQRNIQAGPKRRTLTRDWFASNARRQQASRRAFGRTAHVECALRPRSPPYHTGFKCGAGSAGSGLPRSRSWRYSAGGLSP